MIFGAFLKIWEHLKKKILTFEFRVIKNSMIKKNKNEKEKKGEQLDKKYLNFSLINRFKDIDFTNTTKTI